MSGGAPRANADAAISALQDDDGRFFFWGAGRDTQLRLLGHLVRYSDLLLVMTAPAGGGKTAMVRAFLQSDTSGLHTWALQAQEFMSAEALWAQLCASVQPLARALKESTGGRVAALRTVAGQNQADGLVGVLIVDDAHLLAEDALEFLAEASIGLKDSDGLRIVLVGEPELQAHLDHSRLIERMQGNCHYLSLDLLDEQSMQDYIGQRLGNVGLSIDIFSADELQYILRQGQGLPGALNAAAVRILRNGVPAAGDRATPLIPRVHAYAIGAVLLLILGTYFYSGDESGPEPGPDGSLQAPTVKMIKPPRIVSARPELDRELKHGEEIPDLPVADLASLAPMPVPESREQATADKPKLEPEPEQKPGPEPKVSTLTAPQVSPAPQVRKPAVVASPPPESAPKVTAVAPAPAKSSPPETEPPERVAVTLAPDVALGSAARADKEPTAEEVRMQAFLEGRMPQQRTESWLLEQSPGSYTVQVLGAHNEEAVAKFIAAQERPEAFIYFRTLLKGRDWFVVVIGLYGNRAEAVASIPDLPLSLRKNRPWARSLESIHKAIVEDRPA